MRNSRYGEGLLSPYLSFAPEFSRQLIFVFLNLSQLIRKSSLVRKVRKVKKVKKVPKKEVKKRNLPVVAERQGERNRNPREDRRRVEVTLEFFTE
ncbi:hypothetical protein GCK32_017944 [Trichostrongylus colubriformis]|uniref:Uncharacterized protein n=1 Tax=Trichostrongylus colubriformis TaxID=6319 RepID=A0AAN8IMD4_TRICO